MKVERHTQIVTGRDRFAPGQSDQARHENHVVIFYLHGGCWINADQNDPIDARVGDLILLRPPTLHMWTTRNHPLGSRLGVASLHSLFQLTPQLAALLNLPETIPHYTHLRLSESPIRRRIYRCLLQMEHFSKSALSIRHAFQINLLEQVLLWCNQSRQSQSKSKDSRVQGAIEMMTRRIDQPLRVEQIAAAVNISAPQLTFLFRRDLEQSPMAWLEQLRIERAKELLRLSSMKLDAIADATGFCDSKYFSNRFRRNVGVSPGEFRRRK